jgi:mRNA interferase RelE/StbE
VKTDFKESFEKDVRAVHDKRIAKRIWATIRHVEDAPTVADIRDLKKLKGARDCYRLRMGDYRFGLIIEREMVTFVRFLHRKEIYRFFPPG